MARRSVDTQRGVIAWFTRNTVAANLLMWLIVVSGLLVLPVIKKEVFPDLSVEVVTVDVPYPGAAPEEVEEGVVRKIEEAVQGLTGIKRIVSTAAENAGSVAIEVIPGAETAEVLADVKNRVDAIDTFPEEAEEPVVQELVVRRQVLNVAVSGDVGERVLKEVGQRVRDDLARLPGITQVELVNVRPYEVSIEVSERVLRRHGLTFDEVVTAVQRASLDLPGGSIDTAGGEILLRTKGQAYRGPQFRDLVVLTRPDGSRVRLGDLAQVVDGFAETDQRARFDGEPAVLVQVFRVGDQSALDISAAAREYIARTGPDLPPGVRLTPWRDMTELLRSRMDLLLRNAAQGLLLVFVVLALFLRFRLAFWVSLGIPVSFLGAIALMPTFDVSVNMISLFAFIVVLGIVVDDAIVTGENVFAMLRSGKGGVEAAIVGSKQVAVPVTFGVLTTVAAFAPMLNVDSNAREIWRHVPLIVIPCLVFSLIESKLVLPAHLSHQRPDGERREPRGLLRLFAPIGAAWNLLQTPFTRGLETFVARVYRPVLGVCLRWRYVTWAVALVVFALTVTPVAAGWIRFTFFPSVEGDNVVADLVMPLGTPVEETARALRRVERAAAEVREELERESPGGSFRHVLTSVGEQPYKTEVSQNHSGSRTEYSGAHLGEVNVELVPSEQRTVSAEEVLRRWRERVGQVPGAVELSFTSSIVSSGEDINVQLASPAIADLRAAADELQAYLGGFAGVEDITDSLREGKREVVLDIRPEAQAFGLALEDLARQVRQAFYGAEVQRVQRGREEVKVMVRYPREQRASLGDLEAMRVRTAGAVEIPLRTVADVRLGRGYATIKRTDLARTTNVTAEVDETKGNANQIVAELDAEFVPVLRSRHPGLAVSYEGDTREQKRTIDSLLRGFVVALFAIYALMAVPLRSYLQPLIVMAAIPFGIVGAVWGHVLLGMQLSIVSMLGLVALTGVVVNDSLVLVDFVNQHREGGQSRLEAVTEAGARRFRPILLTSMTTVASLTPMLLERSVQAQFLLPMAVSLASGVLFATVISLVLVPAGFLILADAKRAFRWLLPLRAPEPVSGVPAT